ncbi:MULTISPECIES: ADP-ribosylglycohydrolase family protein [Pseudonocardia]|uniref:ADP-ribosyl-[dinitrogen reductase] glycohydrolase n=2 Tax=Pseudonocardia TaxID=1847 RepID=A0A1Y2MUP9_PSEAH|nr:MULTISPECIES: ADP-ribosylglycohydrolase family protein [Pseudonocardia]OSY38916.1 ADP-ribosyl-[dinitrogen reductase] glycohydrolase [Pseudonocardia autotrophica]TDN76172.1 ADP-ribosylglycohydrolase [Pseudonocardia autotrophica]BBG00153.1 ADP-ribosylglycohydrolase [Pseudonocardia autotrophica]GEC29618.1 ADP-ribosylglycohydrolase [Pseudonocardia saturnea]
MTAERDRALGALLGLAIGDALGMPTQSLSRSAIAERYGIVDRLLDGADDQPIAPNLPAGTVTDDTEQALLLARVLVEHEGRVPPRVFAARLEAWEQEMIRRGSLDLLGPSTRRALTRLAEGEPAERAGRDGTTNGAAMRVTPVGIAHTGAGLLDAVVESAVVTHHTAPGIAAAAAVAAAVSAGVSGAGLGAALEESVTAARDGARRGGWAAGADVAARLAIAYRMLPGLPPDRLADAVTDVVGTSVAATESVVAALGLAAALGDDPRTALVTAASLGGDTDTVAAICGAVLGAVHGVAGLPAGLTATVRRVNRQLLDPLDGLVDGLLTLRADARDTTFR